VSDTDIRVLIVDDNRTVRRGIRLRLENAAGIRVAGEASNGRDAAVLARAERADVVLMDLHMPGMSGIEATRLITSEAKETCRVVLLTSEVSDAFVVEALEAGASGYLLKGHTAISCCPSSVARPRERQPSHPGWRRASSVSCARPSHSRPSPSRWLC